MRRWTIFALLLAPAAAQAQDLDGAQAFVAAIYATYDGAGEPGTPVDPPARLFEPVLAEAIAADTAKAAAAEEVGALDFDPFCQCQDGEPFTAQVAPAVAVGDAAEVRVRFTNLDRESRLRYTLVQTPAGWRIADIDDGEEWSLRALFFPGAP
jgi:hypothetical protein